MKLCLHHCSKEMSTWQLICAINLEPVWQEGIYAAWRQAKVTLSLNVGRLTIQRLRQIFLLLYHL